MQIEFRETLRLYRQADALTPMCRLNAGRGFGGDLDLSGDGNYRATASKMSDNIG